MSTLVRLFLVFLILVSGFVVFYGRSTIENQTKRIFNEETGLVLLFDDWERVGTTITVINPKIVGTSNELEGSITADYLVLKLDIKDILSRRVTLEQLIVSGLQVESPNDESAFFKFIRQILKDSEDPFIKASVHSIRLNNLKESRFVFGPAVVLLKPNAIEFDLSEKENLVKADTPLEVNLELPPALSNFSKVIGSISVAGDLSSPKIVSNLRLKNSEHFQVAASFEKGVLSLKPAMQSKIDGELATAEGNLQLKDLTLTANDFVLKGLPLGLIDQSLANAESQMLAKGELNLSTLSGGLTGAVQVSNIESLPVGVKDLSLDLEVSNKVLKLKQGSLKGEAGSIELSASYDIETKKLSGFIKTENLLVKPPNLKAPIPRGINITTKVDLSGDFTAPKLSGPVILNFFKHLPTGEVQSEAVIVSALDLKVEPKNLMESSGQIKIEPFLIDAQGREVKTVQPTTIALSGGKLNLANAELYIGEKKVIIGGTVSENGYNITASGSGDVASLIGTRERISEISGDLSVKLHLTGALNHPQIKGEVHVANGGFELPVGSERFHLEGISGLIQFDDRKLTLKDFESHGGDAKVFLDGEIDNFLAPNRSGTVGIQVKDAVIQPDQNLSVQFSADAGLKISPDTPPSIKATVSIDDALYEQHSNLHDLIVKLLGLATKGSESVASKKFSSPISAEIVVTGDRSLVVETDIYQGELSTALKVTADQNGILINGRIQGDSGALKFSRNEFDVSRVGVNFENQQLGTYPNFILVAEGELGQKGSEELVQLTVRGQLPTPRIRLRSESSRPQRELLAELGLAIDKLAITSGRGGTTKEFASALNPFSGAGVSDRVGGLTGGATIQVESGYSADTGTFAPRLVLEQALPFDLKLVGQSELTQFNRSQVNLEYPFTEQTNFFTGWKNAPATRNPDTLSGSFGLGVHYRERFPGTLVLPTGLILDNLEGIFGLNDEESFEEAGQ